MRLRERDTLRRIKSLAIPPAWTNVWICPFPDGYIQATGRDAKGRKQYRYNPRFREVRESTKYEHLGAFAEALPVIRAKVREHMALRSLPREKVLATVVHLLETTLIRVGNDDYAKQNNSYGLTGQDITAKDFRTWAGTVLAAIALNEVKALDKAAQAKRNLRTAIENVASRLGNTPTICRKCYVHPEG